MATAAFSDKKEKMLMAALDFGTTFSGYAFSFKADYTKDPTNVSTNQNWVAGSMALMSLKAPTCVLFDENKTFHSFGYVAENTYTELALNGEQEKCYFFKRFKMKLHGTKKVNRDIEIEDDKGRKLPAILVFSEVIKYLKGHLLEQLQKRRAQIDNKDIHWVLTVPAIWTDSAKQFMREAAYKADIDGGLLSIVKEPEAAILYCQLLPTDRICCLEEARPDIVNPGSKIMVINLECSKAEFTVHERQADGGLKELHAPIGSPWGGTQVNEQFNQLLIEIVGAPVFKNFFDKNKADMLDLQREFETKKRTITPASKGKITIKVPVSIAETYKEEMDETIKEAIANSPYDKKMMWIGDKIRIDADIFKGLFKTCCGNIVKSVKDLLQTPAVKGTNIFLMVGGFSESAMVQDEIKKALPNGKIIVPDEAGLSVLKGAVIFGHSPVARSSRVARYTYGINISPRFNASIHPETHRVPVGDFDRCRDVFRRYIQEGDTWRVGEVKSGKHITLNAGQDKMLLNIYASPKREPMFVDEEDTEYLGMVVVKQPDFDEKIKVEVKMMFGETEMIVEAHELTHNTKYTAYFDFL